MNIISLDSFKIIKIKNREYTISKLKYGESIEFSIIYSSYNKMLVSHIFFTSMKQLSIFETWKSLVAIEKKEKELLKHLGIKRYNKKDFKEIIKQMGEWISEENKAIEDSLNISSDTPTKKNETSFPLQQIIAYFAINFHYSKSEVLDLYSSEIPILIKKGDIINETNILKSVSATLNPKDFIKEYKAKLFDDKPKNIKIEINEADNKRIKVGFKAMKLQQKKAYEEGKNVSK